MNGAQPEQAENGFAPPGAAPAQDLEKARRRARRILVGEQLATRLTPAFSVVAAYGVAGFLRLPQSLPDWLHSVLEAGAAGLTVWLVRRGLRFRPEPDASEVDRRIELASGLRNRPLAALTDRLAGVGSPVLWSVYQGRLLASLGILRTGWPRLPKNGAVALAAALLSAAIGTGIVAGRHAPSRLYAALIPGTDDADVPFPHVEAWITPPRYAPSAPVLLSNRMTSPSPVPQGSVLVVTVGGLPGAPGLSGAFSDQSVQSMGVQPMGGQSWRVQAVLDQSGLFRMRYRGRTVAEWTLKIIPDVLPRVVWGKEEPGGARGSRRTRLPYEVSHIYGVRSLVVEMKLAHPRLLARKRVLHVEIPLSGHPVTARGVAQPDLSDDPWAGEDVTASLVATSMSGREARSSSTTFRLGTRLFKSPVAKAVLDLRRRLALGDADRSGAAEDLEALGETPGPIADNSGTFLNLISTVALLNDRDRDDGSAVDEATGRLWDLALDIEDQLRGGREAALASIDVRAAQEAVSEQLRHMRADNAHGREDQDELKKRMDTLRAAIARKMQKLAEQAIREGTAIPDLPGLTKSGDRAFEKLMERLQGDAAEGHESGAMDKLQQLEDSIEKMRNATPQDMAQMARQLVAQQKLKEQVEGLQDLVRQQRGLLDHTQSRQDRQKKRQDQQQDQQGPMGGGEGDLSSMSTTELLQRLGLVPPPGADAGTGRSPQPPTDQSATGQPSTDRRGAQDSDASKDADQKRADGAAQHALMRATQELGDEFRQLSGKDVHAFGEADKAMKTARHALATGDDEAASKAQMDALKALQQGQSQMRQALSGQGGSSGPSSFIPSFGGDGRGSEGQSGAGEEGDGQDEGQGEGRDDDARKNDDRDPLGRSTGEGGDPNVPKTGSLPNGVSRQRAHEIEEELRRRDSDRTRPQEELEYLDRLLKSF